MVPRGSRTAVGIRRDAAGRPQELLRAVTMAVKMASY